MTAARSGLHPLISHFDPRRLGIHLGSVPRALPVEEEGGKSVRGQVVRMFAAQDSESLSEKISVCNRLWNSVWGPNMVVSTTLTRQPTHEFVRFQCMCA